MKALCLLLSLGLTTNALTAPWPNLPAPIKAATKAAERIEAPPPAAAPATKPPAAATLPIRAYLWTSEHNCPFCRMIRPHLDKLYQDGWDVGVIDVNAPEAAQMAQQWKITALPVVQIIRGTEEIDRRVGYYPGEQLQAWFERVKVGQRLRTPPPAMNTPTGGYY